MADHAIDPEHARHLGQGCCWHVACVEGPKPHIDHMTDAGEEWRESLPGGRGGWVDTDALRAEIARLAGVGRERDRLRAELAHARDDLATATHYRDKHRAERDALRSEVDRLRAEVVRVQGDAAGLALALRPLCPCSPKPHIEGPLRECPIHGDGATFVAEVQEMRAQLGQQAQIMREQGAELRDAEREAYIAWQAAEDGGF